MNKNFNTALENALENEFSRLDAFENPYAQYEFSSGFESEMETIITKSEFAYVSVGKRRIRKTLLAALVALLALAITGCAFAVHYIIEWHEDQNHKQGTLDIRFESSQEYPSDLDDNVFPETPIGYVITNQYSDDYSCIISYSHPQGDQISFSQYNDVENMEVSIDNEDAAFESTTINGYKGYTYSKDGINALYWTDSTCFYVLQGTCEMEILLTMSESMID